MILKKIVAIGDSLTYGFPYWPKLSWVQLVGKELGISIINKGINGNTTGQMRARFEEAVCRQHPSHVIIMGGTNDACGRLEAEEVEGNIRSMVEISLEQGIVPILGLPIPCNYPEDEQMLRLYRADMRDIAFNYNLSVIDFFTAFLKSESNQADISLYADVLHPNERGYQVMAANAVKVLQVQKSKIAGK